MLTSTATVTSSASNDIPVAGLDSIQRAIAHAAHLLPAQGPITAFVHHNTLHAFEDLDFDAAVRKGAAMFGCRPYLKESRYREFYQQGRIRTEDLKAVLLDRLADHAIQNIGDLGNCLEIQMAILNTPASDNRPGSLAWIIADTNAMNQFQANAPEASRRDIVSRTRQWVMRDLREALTSSSNRVGAEIDRELMTQFRALFDSRSLARIERWSERQWDSAVLKMLWKTCEYGIQQDPDIETATEPRTSPAVRHRDALLGLTHEDADERVDSILIPFTAAFLDQGFSDWPLSNRGRGFLKCFADVYGRRHGIVEPWRAQLSNLLVEHAKYDDPLQSIQHSLKVMGVQPHELNPFLTQTLLALRGFAGMLWQLETRGDRVTRAMPAGTLVEFLAVRLMLDQLAAEHIAVTKTTFSGRLAQLRPWVEQQSETNGSHHESLKLSMTYRLFQLCQQLGWDSQTLATLEPETWRQLIAELSRYSEVDRRELFHLAYERRLYHHILDSIHVHSRRTHAADENTGQREIDFQMVNCIDDREESLRRHLEEVYPRCETYGAAGFFSIPMYYRGAADAHYTPLCPVVVKPDHYVREEVVYSLRRNESKRKRARRTIGTVTHRAHIGSRTFTGGWIGTALLGTLATFPLVARILFPRVTSRLRSLVGGFVKPPDSTRLVLERQDGIVPGPDKDHLGFTIEEMANSVERLLRDIGATNNLSRLFLVCGHGSSSLNNPHEAAYDCGACAGARGGPNARAFAQMANDSRVRLMLADRGVKIPETTWFVGCYHNTCDDSLTYYDLDQIPPSHRPLFETASDAVEEAQKRDAHERCRRFESAPLDMSFDEALRHVEGRSEDLSQVRPECGHATNAICLVGKREWSRDLFLDRRAFLQSYDPAQDSPDGQVLERILQAVIPVCAGINLEYYFSYVDPIGYGCGTKLPHNVTSLIGVMNGAGSDLRPGLPWQMVEIHEPVRLLFVIETTPVAMKRIIAANEAIRKLCDGHWVQLALLNPETGEILQYQDGHFVLYTPENLDLEVADSSVDWYRGWRDHLRFASIGMDLGDNGDGA